MPPNKRTIEIYVTVVIITMFSTAIVLIIAVVLHSLQKSPTIAAIIIFYILLFSAFYYNCAKSSQTIVINTTATHSNYHHYEMRTMSTDNHLSLDTDHTLIENSEFDYVDDDFPDRRINHNIEAMRSRIYDLPPSYEDTMQSDQILPKYSEAIKSVK